MTDEELTQLAARLKEFGTLFGQTDGEAASSAILSLMRDVSRLQAIIDGRPAINADLPESYIKWSQNISKMELAQGEIEK